mgnify:CR=1 FL=1
MSVPTAGDLLVNEGMPYNETVTVELEDASASDTGWAAELKIARLGTVVLTLTEGSGVDTTPANGSVSVAITLTAAQTAAFDWERAEYRLDLIKDSVPVIRVLQQRVIVTRDVA